MQLSTAKVLSNCTKIAERVVPEDFHIWAKAPDEEFDFRIDRSKIKHHYTTFVEFTPVSPEEEARRHADMMNLVKTGILSTATGRRRYLPHVDPEAEDIRVEAEKLRADPAIRQVLAQIIAQELSGEVERLNKIRALQRGGLEEEPVPSGQGMAQALSSMMRMQEGGYRPNIPGSPEEMAAAMAQAGQPSTGGGISIPGSPIQSPVPYGEVRVA